MKKKWKKRVVVAGVSMAVCFTFTACGDQAQMDRGSYSAEIHASETIGRDAIVLITNSENGVNDLSIKEIKKIYDGTIKDWSEL